jgi:lipopolysaccharide export LptBFGC system permease protein LptF
VTATLAIAARLLLAIPGGYALTAGAVALVTAVLAPVMPRSEAFVLAAMLGFLLYLGILLWAFAEQRLARLGLIVLAGAPACFGLAHVLGG